MKNEKGFTLIEILAVVVILGIMFSMGIIAISRYIEKSKKQLYIDTAQEYISIASSMIANKELTASKQDTVYYFSVEQLKTNDGSIKQSPWGKWKEAYVIVTVDKNNNYTYYWTSVDETHHTVDITEQKDLDISDIYIDSDDILQLAFPIGGRNNIKVIDSEGNVTTTEPLVAISEKKARECYSYQKNEDGTLMVTYYNKDCGTDVVIPGKVGNYTVTKIYRYTFNNMGLTSVVIPASITEIGERAFAYNKLEEVYIPSSVKTIGSEAFLRNYTIKEMKLVRGLVTIGARAFQYNKLTSYNIPATVTSIGSCAYCDNLISNASFIYKTNSNGTKDYKTVIGYIGDLSEFGSSKIFIIPEEQNGIKLESIGSGAFERMSLTNWTVRIPETVKTISSSAFAYSGISHVNIPNGVTSIGSSAFYSNRLESITIPDSVTSIGDLAFNINNVTSPDEMYIYRRYKGDDGKGKWDYTYLNGYAGKNRNNVVIPAGVKTLGTTAFRYVSLTGTLTIPKSVTRIDQLAFQLNRLTYINNDDGKGNVQPFIYKRTESGIDYTNVIGYADMYKNVVVPDGVTTIGPYAFYYTYIPSLTIPEGVTSIGANACSLCKLTHLTIPSTVTSIGTNAFRKEITWTSNNGALATIVNKTGKKFDWKAITGSQTAANFVTGTVENWYGNIEVVSSE